MKVPARTLRLGLATGLFVLGIANTPTVASSGVLPGAARTILGGKASVRVPTGTRGWAEGGLFRVARRKSQASIGRLTVTAFPSDPKLEAADPAELTRQLAGEVLAEVEMRHSGLTRLYWEDLEGPEVVQAASGSCGRWVRKAPARDGTPLHLFVGAVVVRGWVYLVGGVYEEADAKKLLPVADTLLRTLKARPPRENLLLKKKLLGCWDLVPEKGSRTVAGRYVFEGAGLYRYSGEVAIALDGVEGFGDRDEHGSYRVHGTSIHTRNEHGEPGQLATRRKGAVLFLGPHRYQRCTEPEEADDPADEAHGGHHP